MWTRATLSTILFAIAIAPAANAQAPAAATSQTPARLPSMLVPGSTVKLTEHVYAMPDNDTWPTAPDIGIIVGTTGALVIDTGLGEANGRIVLAEVQKVAPGHDLYLVTTHVHPEHDLGAGAFPPSTKMIRSMAEIKEINDDGLKLAQMFSRRSASDGELLKGAEFRKADIVFDQQYDLDLGGVTAHILALGPNHTPGDTAVFVKQDGVLFAGDDAMKGQPNFASPDSSLDHWLTTLDMLAAFKPKIVVPAHGPIGDASYISNYHIYFTTIRDRTRELKKQGEPVDQAVATVSQELKARYPDAMRLKQAATTAYKEAP